MLGIVGIVPDEKIPLIYGTPVLEEKFLNIEKWKIPVERGTTALIASAIKTLEVLNKPNPFVFLVGDIGKGKGSKELYKFLAENIHKYNFKVLTFHYILPEVDGCLKVILAIEKLLRKPFLIADAGFMYAVKMASYANFFDLFTPDIGELAFLADEKAPHPFYTRGFLLAEEKDVETLIIRAYEHKNAPPYLLVKGEKDRIVFNQKVLATVEKPFVPELEAIGGTGDTLTGIVSALIYAGYSPEEACILSAKANRLAGALAYPTPATQISEIINFIPEAIKILIP
ncbi:carbohydrate kinase-related protein [Thermodesulfobacterium geofontis OPF15]|jgi:sugar/nucleoside kinase (ribokinase family)|uniref:Carbohydrate kinase-related protein n=1 Tax=Thermodesulfobacterium geofontis (strain OPF15) TaxID=795359 RepID=F8C1Z1_THEGP|nr:NAD(P)H-hydrate dehydratase [Thermodesulfobacterium geofontis]AEH23320.1 carbohydrate kinase-related protein [Thermodesulfobacterium geofontis OPF15]